MKMKKITAFTAAFLLAAPFTGCSKKSDSSSEASSDSTPAFVAPQYEKDTKTSYSTLNFDFEISDDFILEFPEEPEDKYTSKFEFSSSYIDSLDILGYSNIFMENEFNTRETYRSLLEDQDDEDSNVEDPDMKIVPYNGSKICSYSYTVARTNAEKKSRVTVMSIAYETKEFRLEAEYPPENEEKAMAVLEDIARSAEYTSSYRIPTEDQSFEDDYFKLAKYGPEFDVKVPDSDYSSSILTYMNLTYLVPNNNEEYFFKYRLEVSDADDAEDDYHKKADKAYDNFKNKDTLKQMKFTDVKKEEAEIFGCKADKVSLIMTIVDPEIRVYEELYYFEKNDKVYCAMMRYPDGDEEARGFIDEFIENTTIK